MNQNNSAFVNEKTVKTLVDHTDWNQIYLQDDAITGERAKSDPDAPELSSKIYTKPGKSKVR